MARRPRRVDCRSAIGCATSDEESKPVTYSLTAKQNYEKGLAELKDENFPEAQKYFQFVKQKYPFSKFAVLAELGIADTQFARGNYNEAIDSYKSFARLHPTHEKVEDGYVAFRIVRELLQGHARGRLAAAAVLREGSVGDHRRTARAATTFARSSPTSPYMKKADDIRREVLKRLVDHEVYVARFYLRTDHPKAAAMRLEGAIRRYPGSGREPELLYSLGETYLQHVRSAAREGDVRARRRRTRQRPAGPPLRALPAAHPAALRHRTALQDAHGRAGTRRRLPRRPPPGRAPMAEIERAGLRELVARGRSHYENGEYAEAAACFHGGAAREGALRRRLRHAGRHLPPGGTPGRGGGRCSTRRCASTRPTPRRR